MMSKSHEAINTPSQKVVFLCGLKNCGKTSFAKELALYSHVIWFDSDEEILKNNPQYESCRALYEARGEKTFREEEQKAVVSIIEKIEKIESQETQKDNKKAFIVSLGGGACDANDVLKLAKECGKLVYLYETEHVLFERMANLGLPAYLQEEQDTARKNFHKIYVRRNEIYSCFSNYVIQLPECTKDDVINKILDLLEIVEK